MAIDLPVALQLYSVREEAKADLYDTMKQVAAWGFDGVEFAGFHGHDAPTVKSWLDELGLQCPSTHTGIEQLSDENIDATVSFHQTIGCDTILIPWLPEEKRNSVAACVATADMFNLLLSKLRPLNMRTGFHMHGEDALPLEDGRSPWDIFAELTPEDFILQYDTANGMVGGTDPVATIRQHPGRSVLLHLKEYGDGTGTQKEYEGHGKAVIGAGDVDFPGVLQAAQEVGNTQWIIVEQEGHPTLPPMDAAKLCFDNLKKIMA